MTDNQLQELPTLFSKLQLIQIPLLFVKLTILLNKRRVCVLQTLLGATGFLESQYCSTSVMELTLYHSVMVFAIVVDCFQ